ncbi:MAG: glycosyltransferase family 4 protein [Haliscomenobacter sp.]|nr:glycosyltransferase family 4 protein [Haliscomenobacter sp.]
MADPASERNASKKVLILTYYWPPAGGPGVQRVLKFVKYLPDWGWEPLILTVKNGEYPALDPSLLKEIPEGVKVYATQSLEFFSLFKRLTGRNSQAPIETYILNRKQAGWKDRLFAWIRQNLFLPDARLGWAPFAFRKGMEIIRKEKPALIFSSSPPHSLQLAARRLARQSGLPWVADFRDPWTEAFWDKSMERTSWAAARNKRMEQRVVTEANALIAVSNGVKELLAAPPREHTYVIPNGYDAQDFTAKKEPSSRFRIVYAGHIAASQNPTRFFQAIAALRTSFGDLLDIRFYGKADRETHEAIAREGVGDLVHLLPYLPHDQILTEIVNADLLLLLIPAEYGKGILTGKVFEYLATRNFILGIGDETGDAAGLLKTCRGGVMIDYDKDPAPVLEAQIRRWQEGIPHEVNANEILRYDRKTQAAQLTAIFDDLCN